MNPNFRADLHIHSTASDGTLSPFEILDLAEKIGLSGLSITDHDTVAAYTPELLKEAEKRGLRLVTGVEFSTTYENGPVHILGYNFDLGDTELRNFCQRHRENREKRNRKMVVLLQKKGLEITFEEIEHQGTMGRPHIADLLVKKGYIADHNQAFKRYLGEGKCCYVPAEPVTVEETLDVIHKAKGLAFLAHPHLGRMRTVKKLLEFPFDGLECYYARFPLNEEKPYLQLAESQNLLISGGSDFHGAIKPHNPLGASWIDEERFNQICQSR